MENVVISAVVTILSVVVALEQHITTGLGCTLVSLGWLGLVALGFVALGVALIAPWFGCTWFD